jgi:hypothetical protein
VTVESVKWLQFLRVTFGEMPQLTDSGQKADCGIEFAASWLFPAENTRAIHDSSIDGAINERIA